eukprot:CAMPEP_0171211830 /NCGR_PEP_ID=MMETSP0790-20130122/29823_1 /TAXON_ID=2925 /ORGANISM="Alexandrium catenella, Strain OF101" /LENGTH=102 /DNA_ID=CAMNT_0011677503 /DNA_START=163 /DNA_END=468 /DNA_ORIENTATION=-
MAGTGACCKLFAPVDCLAGAAATLVQSGLVSGASCRWSQAAALSPRAAGHPRDPTEKLSPVPPACVRAPRSRLATSAQGLVTGRCEASGIPHPPAGRCRQPE